jgi:DNA-binding response OmpR family regulator
MRGDREKSIVSGASDYVTKPVDPEHLLEQIRHWLGRASVMFEAVVAVAPGD